VREGKSVIRSAGERIGITLSNHEIDQILAEVEKQRHVFGPLQDFVDDPSISDIIVSSFDKVSIRQGARNVRTDMRFPDQRSYLAFVERLLAHAGASCTTRQPVADGVIGSLARIHVVHGSVCEGGPYLTIRINRFPIVRIADLKSGGLAPQAAFEYLNGIVKSERSILIAGEVGAGKTTLARALGAQIDPSHAIVVIEDTPEIRLEHPHVRYIRTRPDNSEGIGRVAPGGCIRAAMRMAMNRIIFGEIRDPEAAESFIDCCASGHAGLSTIHARSALDAVARLELFLARNQPGAQRGVYLEQIASAVQVVVYLEICRASGLRRISQIKEIGPYVDGVLRQRDIFTYQFRDGRPGWKAAHRFSVFRAAPESRAVPSAALENLETIFE
jgi:pilus assembly protein CpaF